MSSVNRVMLVGRVGKDPFIAATKNGYTRTAFSLATDYTEAGEKKTEWHNVQLFNKVAEETMKSLIKKGNLMYVEGRIKTNEYTDKAGVTHKGVEILASTFQTLKKSEQQTEEQTPTQTNTTDNSFDAPAF